MKIPCRFQSEERVGNQFRCCTVLQNMIADYDAKMERESQDNKWTGNYGGVDGFFTAEEVTELRKAFNQTVEKTPINKLFTSATDGTGIGLRPSSGWQWAPAGGGAEIDKGWASLREALVDHCAYAYRHGLAQWVPSKGY